jgi:hypothetical protein
MWGRERRLRAWGSCPTHSGGLGYPSGPITGVCHCELAGRGQASGEKNAVLKGSVMGSAKSPEERTRVLKRRDGASKDDAVASISRRSGKQAAVTILQGASFGAPPPSLLIESEVP